MKFTGDDGVRMDNLTDRRGPCCNWLTVCVRMCVCSEEEINNMKLELDKYGIQMPAFNKIGGILANELSVDQASGKPCC